MKRSFIVCICSMASVVTVLGQSPTAPPAASASLAQSATPAASIGPTASVPASNDLADRIQQRIDKKFRGHHGFVIGDHDAEGGASGEIPGEVIPIVAITMLTVFGAPVLIVTVIMLINYARARSLHRTVQAMVEKGQPVPAALLAPPAVPRPRSDLRRGVILIAIGIGVMTFFGVDEGWHDSAWAFGLIPGLIGVGYLIVWKLEGKKTDNPPPVS